MKNKFIYLTLLAAGLIACEPEFDNEVSNSSYSAGEADFTSYVAIGNSLTAGFMDGTVSRVGQTYSFPNLLAQQFSLVGGGEFTQPSFEDDVNNLGGLTLGGMPIANTRLVIDASAGGPEPIAGVPTIEVSSLQATAYHNMGVPLAKSFHLLAPGYGNLAVVATGQANPYFVRHATSPTATVMEDVMSKNPTFFTNWIGNNDVLSFATSGGVGVSQEGNLDPSSYGPDDITDSNVFAASYSAITDMLTANGAKGVVATIPNVTSIPYFTTVPYNPVPMDAQTAAAVNTGFAQYNQGLQVARGAGLISAEEAEARTISFSAGTNNSLVIEDQYLTNLSALGLPSYRQTTSNDLIVLTARTIIGTPVNGNPQMINGVSVPLADKWVLVPQEKAMVDQATQNFNNTIRAVAASKNLAVADMNAILNNLIDGLRFDDGTIYTADYFSTSTLITVLFSLDGIHPNARGYALVASEIIKVINEHYNAKLPLLNPAYYPGATVLPSN